MKKLLALSLCVLLTLCLAVPSLAAEPERNASVADECHLLSGRELSSLQSKADQIHTAYGIDAAVFIMQTFGISSPEQTARQAQTQSGFSDGIILVIDYTDRDYCLRAFGKGIDIFTDYGLEKLEDEFLPYLEDDAFYDGFAAYLDAIPSYCEAYEKGDPIDRGFGLSHILIALVIGLAVGGITILVMRSAMNTAKPKPSATEYVRHGSFRPYGNFDMYLYSRVTRTPRQNNSSGSGGGSSGGSSRSRSGKF